MKHATEYLTFETPHRRDYVNITDRVEAFVGKSGIQHGLVLVNPMHITAAVFVNDASMRVDASARQALAATVEGDMLRTMIAALGRWARARRNPSSPLQAVTT